MAASQKAENCATAKGAASWRCAIAVCRKLPTSDSNSERVGWPRRTLTWRLTSRCVKPCRNSLIAGYSALSLALTSQSRSGPGVSCAHLRRLRRDPVLTAAQGLAVAQPPDSRRAQVEGRDYAAGAE